LPFSSPDQKRMMKILNSAKGERGREREGERERGGP